MPQHQVLILRLHQLPTTLRLQLQRQLRLLGGEVDGERQRPRPWTHQLLVDNKAIMLRQLLEHMACRKRRRLTGRMMDLATLTERCSRTL